MQQGEGGRELEPGLHRVAGRSEMERRLNCGRGEKKSTSLRTVLLLIPLCKVIFGGR
jgi:hypothetical protein